MVEARIVRESPSREKEVDGGGGGESARERERESGPLRAVHLRGHLLSSQRETFIHTSAAAMCVPPQRLSEHV